MMARLSLLIIVSAIAVTAASCGGEDELPATLANVQAQVFDKSCNNFSGCHNGASPAGQLSLLAPIVVADLMRPSVADPARTIVVPGDAAKSFMIDKLRDRNLPVPNSFMPPGQPLDEARLSLVERWIAAGAPQD